ncbi:MAG: mechanosensitive ion channel [Verrucomicrobia bacterium]|nr:mechanosensitive ion channel [Verrucomicrobiota bacterium]
MLKWLLISGVLAMWPAPAARGQISTLKKAAESLEPAKPAPPEKPEDNRARLVQWHQEARDTLARLEAPGAATALPEGISAAELDDRRRDLDQMVLTSTRSLKNLSAVDDARKTLEASRADEAAWTGFKHQPPYSLLMIDDLLNDRDAVKANISSSEASLSNFERIHASIVVETKSAEETVNRALSAVQKASDGTIETAKWRLEAARARSRLLAARAGLMQSSCDSLSDRLAAAKIDLTLLERQVKVAKAKSRFNDEDLAKLGKISEDHKQTIRKEIDGVAKRLKAAMTTRTQAQAALDALVAAAPANAEPPGLELAKYRLDVAEGSVEAMQSLTEGLESLIQLENVSVKAYQDRRALIEARNPQQRTKTLESLGVPREQLWTWENVLDDELSNSSAALSKLDARAASISSEDPRFGLLNEQRAATSEKLAMLQRVSQAVMAQRKLVKRWVLEYSPDPNAVGLFDRLASLGPSAWVIVKKIWSFKVMTFEDKVEVDGETITGKLPVTLGMLLRAALFFLIGYWLASLIARRIQAGLVAHGHIAEAQARTLRNWGMIVVGLFLVIGTLAFLKIPLTVFAFFGGALAIGLGIGTQTLIKNFISGIIVLAERKVRVGDVVDVDGIVGTVTEVNTRSSVVRSPDDVETMIPNSVFLENRVTNWTLSNTKMRRSLRVGVAYDTPPPKVMELLTEAAGRHGLVCKEPAPFAVFDDFGDSALMFSLYFWLDLGGSTNAMIVTSDLRLMIEKRLTELDLRVPFPQRDVHLATGQPLQVQWVPPTASQADATPAAPQPGTG